MKTCYEKYIKEDLISKLTEEIQDNDNILCKEIAEESEYDEIKGPKKKACTLCAICVITFENNQVLYHDLLTDGIKHVKKIKRGDYDIVPLEKETEEFLSKIFYLINHETLCVDEHHADQLMIFMALAEGTSKIRTINPLSGHINGMMRIIQQMIPEAEISTNYLDECTEIEIKGIGLTR